MLRLIKFLYVRRVLLVFLFLEITSIVLLRKSSPYYSASYFSSSNSIVSFVYDTKSTILDYFELDDTNKKLLEENALLKGRLYNRYSSLNYLKKSYKNQYEAIESMVINNTVNQSKNFITIDIGENEGVKVGMGVVGEKGVLGRVYAVNNNYAAITSILHTKVNTSVKVGKNKVLATMKWDSKDYRYMNIHYLPKHVKVIKGDSVFTSGFNSIYPEGIFLGTINEISTVEDKSFHDVSMRLVNNFNRLEYAYVVSNKRLFEIEEVELTTEDE